MFAPFTATIATDREHELQTAAQHPAAVAERRTRVAAPTRPVDHAPVVIRAARAADAAGLDRLGHLDGDGFLAARLAGLAGSGDVLVAEVDGDVVAAIVLGEDRVAADPFRPTARVAELLRMRATQVGALPQRRRLPLAGALRPRLH